MKLDMKFGWRPGFNDKDKMHRKEAIAIKLGYPNNQDIWLQSVRNSALCQELYKFKKSKNSDKFSPFYLTSLTSFVAPM